MRNLDTHWRFLLPKSYSRSVQGNNPTSRALLLIHHTHVPNVMVCGDAMLGLPTLSTATPAGSVATMFAVSLYADVQTNMNVNVCSWPGMVDDVKVPAT